jgi:hypothetical protein
MKQQNIKFRGKKPLVLNHGVRRLEGDKMQPHTRFAQL